MRDENVEPRPAPGLDPRLAAFDAAIRDEVRDAFADAFDAVVSASLDPLLAAIRDETKAAEDEPGPSSGGPATISPKLVQIAAATRERERSLSRRTFRTPFARE